MIKIDLENEEHLEIFQVEDRKDITVYRSDKIGRCLDVYKIKPKELSTILEAYKEATRGVDERVSIGFFPLDEECITLKMYREGNKKEEDK